MKSSKLILALWLGVSAWAQTPPLKQQANAPIASKPGASQTVSHSASSPKPSSTPTAPKTVPPAAPRNDVKKTPVSAPATAKLAATKPSTTKPRAKSSSSKTAVAADGKRAPTRMNGRRDPFVSPVVDRIRVASCSGSGKQCLVIGEISLHGVVHSPSGFLAVVMNGEHTYFLRENDPLADGSVERITKDAIILRERSSDVFGRPVMREVTKRLGVPPA